MSERRSPEERLIERAKNGDLRAFEEVYKQYGRKLFGLCLRMCGNEADAEELMQEIFMNLLGKIKTFRGDAKFSTWLYRVGVNTCISHLRRRRIQQIPLDEELESSPVMGVNAPPLLQRESLKRALAELPAGYKSAVIMHDIQGFNHREIADVMGISIGASKSQLFKARRRLRELIEGSRTADGRVSG